MKSRHVAVVSTLVALNAACASTTQIMTEPSGAKVYADGNLLGTSPVTYSDTKIIGASTQLTFKKEGCRDNTVILSRSEEFQVGPCIGGALVLVPFLWVMGYRPMHTYSLDCDSKAEVPLRPREDEGAHVGS